MNLGSNLSSKVSSRYLDRSNEVLDYIDCISNEEVPFEIPISNSKENIHDSNKENELTPEGIQTFNDNKDKDAKHLIKGEISSNFTI